MTFKIRIKNRQFPLYLFLIFFCYLYVFQYVFRSNIGEVLFMVLIPVLSIALGERGKIEKYMFPIFIMFVLIVVWSTEPHRSFLYYAIMVECLVFIKPRPDDFELVIRVLKRTAMINAFFVLFSRTMPGIMALYARIVFSDNIALSYAESMNRGYYSGLNNQVAFTAVYLAIGIIIYTYDTRISNNKRLFCLLYLWLSLVATNKRSHILYVLISLLIVYYVSGVKNKKINRGIKVVFGLTVLIIGLQIVTYIFPTVPVFNRLRQVFSLFSDDTDANLILSGRVAIYNQVLELFKANKVLGIGWQNFGDFSRYRSITGGVNQGHNVFLQLLCETGIIGFVCFMILNAYYIISNFRLNSEYIRTLNVTTGDYNYTTNIIRKCSLTFMLFYYLFWFSGNALYDFTFVYLWVLSILLMMGVKKTISTNINTKSNMA